VTEREERNSVAIASNESQMDGPRPSPTRACARAIVDRLAYGGNIIESYRSRGPHGGSEGEKGELRLRHTNSSIMAQGCDLELPLVGERLAVPLRGSVPGVAAGGK
jgi:hypothetical protein